MTPALQTLILILLGLGVMLGLVRPKRIGTFLAGLILGPLLAEVLFSFGNQIFLSLTVLQQALFLVLVLAAAGIALLRFALPKGAWESLIGDLVYDLLKSAVLLSFKTIARTFRLIIPKQRSQG